MSFTTSVMQSIERNAMHMAIVEAFEEWVKSGEQFTGDEGAVQRGSTFEDNCESGAEDGLLEKPMKNESEMQSEMSDSDEGNTEPDDSVDEVPHLAACEPRVPSGLMVGVVVPSAS